MANTVIQLKHSTVQGNVPVSLANGEISINTRDGKIFYAEPDGTVVEFSTPASPSGLNGEIQFNDSGSSGANSQLTFEKSTGTFRTNNVTSNSVASNTYIQFGDGTKQYTANAGSGGGSGEDQYARDTANASFIHANAAFDKANAPYEAVTASTFNTTANGLANTYDLGFNPVSPEAIFVTLDGVVQPESTYTVNTTSNTITFATNPGVNESIRVVNFYTKVSPYILSDGSIKLVKFDPEVNVYIQGYVSERENFILSYVNTAITNSESSALALAIALG